MQITVTRIRGRTTLNLDVNSNDTIDRVMDLIKERLDIPTEWQKLLYNNQRLEIGHTLEEYNIQSGTTINLEVNFNNRPYRQQRDSCLVTNFKKRQTRIRRKKFRPKTVIKKRVIF